MAECRTESTRKWPVPSGCSPSKNAQRKSCELSFIWGKMRTAARETASQIALRTCSEEARGEPGCTGVLQQRAGSRECQKILVN